VSQWAALAKDKDPGTRSEAAQALREIGPGAKAAVPALTELLNDKDWLVRKDAAAASGVERPRGGVPK
jgi:HEAT repeat protein